MKWTPAKIFLVITAAVLLAGTAAVVGVKATRTKANPAQCLAEGWRLQANGKPREAIESFRRATRLAPGEAEGWNGLGWAQLTVNALPDAEQAFQKVLSLNPDHPGALNGLGQIYFRQKNYDQAEKYFLQAAAKVPASPPANAIWHKLAELYLSQGKFDQVETWARKSVDSGGGGAEAALLLKTAREKKREIPPMEMIKAVNEGYPASVVEAKMLIMSAVMQRKIPAAANWCETLNAGGRIWPAAPTNTSFALNASMAGRALARGMPGNVVVFFETFQPGWNRVGGSELLAKKSEGVVVAYLDGRSALVPPGEVARLRWAP